MRLQGCAIANPRGWGNDKSRHRWLLVPVHDTVLILVIEAAVERQFVLLDDLKHLVIVIPVDLAYEKVVPALRIADILILSQLDTETRPGTSETPTSAPIPPTPTRPTGLAGRLC